MAMNAHGLTVGRVPEELATLLPDRAGDFRAEADGARPINQLKSLEADFNIISSGERGYRSAEGKRFIVYVAVTGSDSSAYSLLTNVPQSRPSIMDGSQWAGDQQCDIAPACMVSNAGIAFSKGKTFVAVFNFDKNPVSSLELRNLAQLVSNSIDPGERDIPVLVRHLPDWQNPARNPIYAVSLNELKRATGQSPLIDPLLDLVSFEGGTEAVSANYDSSRLVIIEYMNPQIAADNDSRIKKGIEELKSTGKETPSGYRRVGNYSVFVLGALDEKAATHLIDQVHYEQLVQWLGPNPHALERAQKRYAETTANMIVSVLKASGLSLGLCLGVGGIFGALVFRRRRAQQNTSAAYSDAGGMIRLNIDDMVATQDIQRLTGSQRDI